MARNGIASFGSIVALVAFGSAAAPALPGGGDTYATGAAVAWLPQEFVLGGAIPLGANFAFPGNPFTPIVNGGPVPLYNPVTQMPTNMVAEATGVENGDGSWTVSLEVFTIDGAAFVTKSTPLQVPTECCGLQPVTDFVIDLGNGYQVPGFPVDGVDIPGDTMGTYFVAVEYYFFRLDGTQNLEFGDTTGPFLLPEGFCFAWGYAVEDAMTMNRAGFVATFTPTSDPECPKGCADVTGDCVVSGDDLAALLAAWGTDNAAFDFTGDGVVGGADLSYMLSSWGECAGG